MDFLVKLTESPVLDEKIRGQASKLLAMVGHPNTGKDPIDRPVVVFSDKPGSIIWGLNGWKRPHQSLLPDRSQIFRSRFAQTPLLGPTREGKYLNVLGPFSVMPGFDDERKKILVQEVNYRLMSPDGTMGEEKKVSLGRDYIVNHKTPKTSPLIIEGHSRGMGNAHGISIYLPWGIEFKRSYLETKFAKDTQWDELVSTIPSFQRTSPILVLGLGREQSWIPKILTALELPFDYLDSASLYRDYEGILSQYTGDGLVICGLAKIPSKVEMFTNSLSQFASSGGKLLVFDEGYLKYQFFEEFFRETFGISYGGTIKEIDSLEFRSKDGNFELVLDDATLLHTTVLKPVGASVILQAKGGKVFGTEHRGSIYLSVPVHTLKKEDLFKLFTSLLQR